MKLIFSTFLNHVLERKYEKNVSFHEIVCKYHRIHANFMQFDDNKLKKIMEISNFMKIPDLGAVKSCSLVCMQKK